MSNLQIVNQNRGLSGEQIDILTKSYFANLNVDELRVAIEICNRTHLDPFMKQIHFIVRKDSKTGKTTMVPQTSIDGFRLIAQRTGLYAGSDDPIFDDEHEPTKATVTVYKIVGGIRCPFTASARWAEFYPGDAVGFMWRKMPCVMLGKCAEAQALRKAFASEMHGIYAPEEMAQADVTQSVIKTNAEKVQELVSGPKEPEHVIEDKSPIEDAKRPLCRICNAEMIVASSGASYYCPKWKEKELGKHSQFAVAKLDEYLKEQE